MGKLLKGVAHILGGGLALTVGLVAQPGVLGWLPFRTAAVIQAVGAAIGFLGVAHKLAKL